MKTIIGDIWHFTDALIVIPINLEGVCGRGLAKQMADKYPHVAGALRTEGKEGRLAQWCDASATLPVYTPVMEDSHPRLVMFPVKRSWKDEADLEMINLNCGKLRNTLMMLRHPYLTCLPLVGCGYGELSEAQVMPILDSYFNNDPRVVLCLPDKSVFSKYPAAFKPGIRSDKSAVEANR